MGHDCYSISVSGLARISRMKATKRSANSPVVSLLPGVHQGQRSLSTRVQSMAASSGTFLAPPDPVADASNAVCTSHGGCRAQWRALTETQQGLSRQLAALEILPEAAARRRRRPRALWHLQPVRRPALREGHPSAHRRAAGMLRWGFRCRIAARTAYV